MSLLWPWALAGLALVAAAAAWALRRPARQVVLVGSLNLWRRALEALGPSAGAPSRRLSGAWLLLLAGAVLAVLALARPVWYARSPARRVAVEVCPSAELAGLPDGMIPAAVQALLRRLDARDQVRLVLPTVLGGAGPLVPRDQAMRQAARLTPVPARAKELDFPAAAATPGGDVQHTYRFLPAVGPGEPDAPSATTIALPVRPGELTLDAFAIEESPAAPALPSTAPGGPAAPRPAAATAQVFLAVRNHTDQPRTCFVTVRREDGPSLVLRLEVPAASGSGGGRAGQAVDMPAGGRYYQAHLDGQRGFGSAAFLVRRDWPVCRVAMIGRDDPYLRRFIRVHPGLRLLPEAPAADVVFAVGVNPPPDRPALAIAPPDPPPGFAPAGELTDLALADAAVAADHPLTRRAGHRLDLSAVAVRRAAGWAPAADAGTQAVVSRGDRALLVARDRPRQVFLAFDTATVNSDFALRPAFVIFLANVVAYLHPAGTGRTEYVSTTPLSAGATAGWTLLTVPPADGAPPLSPGATAAPLAAVPLTGGTPLPAPGVYRDPSGQLHALSLTGLGSAPAMPRPGLAPAERGGAGGPSSAPAPQDPLAQAASVLLPAPAPVARPVELWPFLAAAAVACWLAGWAARLR